MSWFPEIHSATTAYIKKIDYLTQIMNFNGYCEIITVVNGQNHNLNATDLMLAVSLETGCRLAK